MGQERVQRRLAAIFAADVVGYSRLTSIDEEGTLDRLRMLQRDVVYPPLDGYHGRLVKTTGDGVLAEFASVVDAVRCSLDIQRRMAMRNADLAPNNRIEFRIGIHLGDVVVQPDGDLLGDGVNIAVRLEGIAAPGGICLSEDAYRQVRDRLKAPFADFGDKDLKNIARPVRVYGINTDAIAALPDISPPAFTSPADKPSTTRPGWLKGGLAAALLAVLLGAGWWYLQTTRPPPVPRFSIVVLPFTNLGAERSQDYVADVLTGELTTYLSRIPGSFVIAPSTAFTYKGKAVDAKQLGKELGVRFALEGSIEPSGRSIRTNAQLVDTESGAQLWADQFDEDNLDLLATQDAIVTRLARALQIQVASVEAARLEQGRSRDPVADDLAERCEAIFLRYSNLRREIKAAYPLCEKAIAIDPRNLRALGILARLYAGRAVSGLSADAHADLIAADDMASRALALDPNQSLPRQARAFVRLVQGKSEESLLEAQRSVALNPSDIGAYAVWCFVEIANGHPKGGIECAKKAIRLSPRDPFRWAFYNDLGRASIELKQYDQAIEWLRRAVAENPDFVTSLQILTAALALDGRIDEARDTLARYLAHPLTEVRSLHQVRAQAQTFFDAATQKLYLEGLSKAGMPE